MATAPVPGNIAVGERLLRFAVIGQYQEQLIVNTWYYIVADSVITPGELGVYAFDFWTYIKTELRACTVDSMKYKAVQASVVDHPEVPSETLSISPELAGTVEGDGIPLTVAMIIKKLSHHGGKRGRGRNYIAAIPLNQQTASVVNPVWVGATVDNLLNKLDDIIPTGDTGQLVPAVYSPNKVGETGTKASQIIKAVVEPVLGNQRRRRPGRGA